MLALRDLHKDYTTIYQVNMKPNPSPTKY